MHVMLILPPAENTIKYFQGWQLDSSDYGTFPPLGILYIAAVVKKELPDIKIKVVDCSSGKVSYSQLEKIIRDFKPDVAGITAYSLCLIDVFKTAKLIKSLNNNTHICIGGAHNFIFPRQTLEHPEVDSVVIGEGEYVFTELLRQIRDKNLRGGYDGLYIKSDLNRVNFKKAVVDDINNLPFFDISLIDRGHYRSTVGVYKNIITLLSSRGCPYSCTFCDSPYKVFRGRSIDNIIDEIKLRLRQGYKEIFFYDDTFNITPNRIIEFSKRVLNEKMEFYWSFRGRVNSVTYDMLKMAKRAGCIRIHFGIETGTDEGLRELKKGITVAEIKQALSWCRKLRIKTIGDFIIGLPFERDRHEVLKNIKRLIDFSPDYAQFNILQPMPGTEIFRQGVEKGIIDDSRWFEFVKSPYNDFKPPLWESNLSSDELSGLYRLAYRKFYIRLACIIRNLTSIRTPTEIKRLFYGGKKILFKT